MTPKHPTTVLEILHTLDITSVEQLLERHAEFEAIHHAAELVSSLRVLTPIAAALKVIDLPKSVHFHFFESAGQDGNDDRGYIEFAVYGATNEQAAQALHAFQFGDFGELIKSGELGELPGEHTYVPDDPDSMYRTIIDALTPHYGEFMDVSVSAPGFIRDVQDMAKTVENLTGGLKP